MMTPRNERQGSPISLLGCLALSLLVSGCSLKQRAYAFASAPTPRMGSYGGQGGPTNGYPGQYGNYGAPTYPAAQDSATQWCNQVDSTYVGFASAAAGGAVAAGSLGTIAGISDVDKNSRIGLAIGSGALAALSAVFSVVSQAKGQQFQRQCPQVPQ